MVFRLTYSLQKNIYHNTQLLRFFEVFCFVLPIYCTVRNQDLGEKENSLKKKERAEHRASILTSGKSKVHTFFLIQFQTHDPGSANSAALVYLVQVCWELEQNKVQDQQGRSLGKCCSRFSSSSSSASTATPHTISPSLQCQSKVYENLEFLKIYNSFVTISTTDSYIQKNRMEVMNKDKYKTIPPQKTSSLVFYLLTS